MVKLKIVILMTLNNSARLAILQLTNYAANLVPRVSHLTAPRGRGKTRDPGNEVATLRKIFYLYYTSGCSDGPSKTEKKINKYKLWQM